MPIQPISSSDISSLVERNAVVAVCVGVSWSAACREFTPVFESLMKRRADVQFAFVDADADPSFAGNFEIRGFPTVLIYKDGALSHTVPSALTEPELQALLDEVVGLRGGPGSEWTCPGLVDTRSKVPS